MKKLYFTFYIFLSWDDSASEKDAVAVEFEENTNHNVTFSKNNGVFLKVNSSTQRQKSQLGLQPFARFIY
jgi:hypothetical protein